MKFIKFEGIKINPVKILWVRPISDSKAEIKLDGGESFIVSETCDDVVDAIEAALNTQPESAPKTTSKKK